MAAKLPIDYLSFTEKDFIRDPFFQEWVSHASPESNAFWQHFIAAHPYKAGSIEQAATFLKNLRFEEHLPQEARIKQLYRQHLIQVEQLGRKQQAKVRSMTIWRVAIAAVLAGILAGAYFLFFYSTPDYTRMAVATDYGEKRKVLLSDSSAIVLNAHSEIRFDKTWKAGHPREVWLDGEAFFNVKHINTDRLHIKPEERFIIHGQDFTIEVLGTSFNVRQRRGRTEIVLQTGKIRLILNDSAHTELYMKPGEMVTYKESNQQVICSATEPRDYTAWRQDKLMLVNPELQEITSYLEDNYGKKIVISDAALSMKKIEGPILLNNLDDALFIISTVLKAKIERTDSCIIIRPK